MPTTTYASLRVQRSGSIREYPLTLLVNYIGRAADNQIMLDESAVSGHHAKLEWSSGALFITDLESTHGTILNDKGIEPGIRHPLKNADVIHIGSFVLTVQYLAKTVAQKTVKSQQLALQGQSTVSIGRESDNDIVVQHPTVSRRHARVIWNARIGKHLVEDLHSTNGTFVNGQRVVRPVLLRPGDIIQIGSTQLVYKLERISAVDQSRDLRIDGLRLNRLVRDKNLLRDISISIQPREFVAIVGASGAGKSTLLHALSGYYPATSGAVLVNGVDMYSNYDAYRSQIGFVPQSNILHMELTVYEAFNYSVLLRLPSDTSQIERDRRITQVLDTLGLKHCRDQPIRTLSGGEQKRASIGIELLTEPGLFFLDEATSGLDPGTELEIMALLRRQADMGRTIVLVTHATKNVEKCHSVAILARGGYLAYFGPPKDALTYFGVGDFDEIYAKLRSTNPKAAAERYLKSGECQTHLTARLPKDDPGKITRTAHATSPGSSTKRGSSLRQFSVLSRRNISVLLRDRLSLMLMLLVPPVIASLFFMFWRKGLFAADIGDARFALLNLFMAAIVCCLVGALSSMREIVKEADIYRRERMVVIRILPYVMSKVLLCVLLALYSAAVFILFMELSGGWPPMSILPSVYLTMVLSVFGGALMGLFMSALSPNPNATPMLLLLVLVPQLLFGGIIPANDIAQPGRIIGYATTTKWTFESLVRISGMGDDVIADVCWGVTGDEREPLTEGEQVELCKCTGANLFSECGFPGVRSYYVPEIDESEPLRPSSPGDPPTDPQDMEAYDEAMRRYEIDTDNWQDEYRNWQDKRGKAIGQAEGTIRAVYDDYGHAFKANVRSNWRWLAGISLVLFCGVLVTLKRKDRR